MSLFLLNYTPNILFTSRIFDFKILKARIFLFGTFESNIKATGHRKILFHDSKHALIFQFYQIPKL